MAVFRRGSVLLASLTALTALCSLPGGAARADDTTSNCRVVNVDFTPGGIAATGSDPEYDPQIVAWLEKPDGTFVQTVYITQQTGRYGMGNRPGRFDFNSGPNWPYGRRTTVFPVWAHRHGMSFPEVDFQSGTDSDLSHSSNNSSGEPHYCRPLDKTGDQASWDAATCATHAFTDKGKFGTATSVYPPRADLTTTDGIDSSSVAMYKQLNPFDAISSATPKMGTETTLTWAIPTSVPMGDYVMFVEVALEQDFNTSYNATVYPPPEVAYGDYGVPYRGQPSVVYQVPFTVAAGATTASTDAYAGYGDPDGGATLHLPDATITSNVPNSGALRLIETSKDGQMFRVRVNARTENDTVPPAAPGAMAVTDASQSGGTLSFTAPGDDGLVGLVTSYDIRYMEGDVTIDESNFAQANEVAFTGTIVNPGQLQSLAIANLLPETEYTVAVRGIDNCGNLGPIATTTFTTTDRTNGSVDACFIATAAYGSVMANDVEMLRRFRDLALKHTVLGELAVETYYTFGPPVAGVVGESDLLRATAREMLAPVVDRVRSLRWSR